MMGTVGIVLACILVGALVIIAVASSTRGTPVEKVTSRRDADVPAAGEPEFRHAVEVHTTTPLRPGHRVELLQNGDETYPRLWEDIRTAKRFIAIQMYYVTMGRVSEQLHELLVERARAGVDVMVLYDAFGSKIRRDYLRSLKEAGVQVAKFRPLRPLTLRTAAHRAHVRVIVVDGEIGYTGGFGIDDKWLGGGRREKEWRDTNVRFTGPSVALLMATFTACWAEATGELVAGASYFAAGVEEQEKQDSPSAERAPGAIAGLLHGVPTVGSTDAERFMALTFAGARRRLWITNAYFVPDDDFRRFMKEAVRRGADVRVLTAGDRSDVRTTLFAARARYEELLEGGVRIFEYQPTMIHAKTMVVDGIWSSVGTMNADNRSLAFSNECTLAVHDAAFAGAVERMFLADLEHAKEIDLETFRRRPWYLRPIELIAHMMSRVL